MSSKAGFPSTTIMSSRISFVCEKELDDPGLPVAVIKPLRPISVGWGSRTHQYRGLVPMNVVRDLATWQRAVG